MSKEDYVGSVNRDRTDLTGEGALEAMAELDGEMAQDHRREFLPILHTRMPREVRVRLPKLFSTHCARSIQ